MKCLLASGLHPPCLWGAGQASGQMSTYQRVMKYIYTQIHAHMDGTCVAIYCQAHKQQRHPLAAAFCRAPAWYMNYADARGQEECVCVCVCIGVCVGVCTALCMCVCVCVSVSFITFWLFDRLLSVVAVSALISVSCYYSDIVVVVVAILSFSFPLCLSLSLSSSCPSSSLSSVALKAKSKLLITSTVSGAAFYICHVQGF